MCCLKELVHGQQKLAVYCYKPFTSFKSSNKGPWVEVLTDPDGQAALKVFYIYMLLSLLGFFIAKAKHILS